MGSRPLGMVLAILLLSVMGGCQMGPDYSRPDLELPSEFRRSMPVPQAPETEIDLAVRSWQEVYQDPHLQHLIATGLTENLDLALAQSRLNQARLAMAVSRSPLFPQLDLGLESERERDSLLTNSSAGPETTSNLELGLSWEIDLWGKVRRTIEASEARWLATVEERQALRVSLIGQIASVYFELLDIDNRLAISESTVASREEGVHFERLRKDQGVVSELEVQQAEVELASAKARLPLLKRNRLLKENQLSILLGRAPGSIDRDRNLGGQFVPDHIPAGLPSTLLQRRPDIRKAEQELIAANAAIGIAEAALYPSLSLTGMYGRESESLRHLLTSGGGAWTMGFDAVLPVFTAGRNRAELALAREQCEQARIHYRQVVLQALQEVSNALESFARTQEDLEAQENLVSATREYVRLGRLQYYNGVLSYLDLLDAQRSLFNAELALSESKRDRLLVLVQLYKALGGGWSQQDLSMNGS